METSDLTQGALQQLLQSYNPDERKNALERRQQAQAQHISVLNEPMPDQGPINRMVNDYLMRYAQQPNRPSASAIAAIGAEGASGQKAAENQLLRRQQSAEQEAKYAGEAVKEAGVFGTKLVSGVRGGKGSGVTVKMDKDGNMVVYDPLTQESRVVHSSQRGEYQRLWSKAYEKAVQEDLENPEGYAANVASKVLSASPGFNPQVQPMQNKVPPQPMQQQPNAVQGTAPTGNIALQIPQGQGDPDLNKLSPTEQQVASALKAGTGMAQNPATAQQGNQMLSALQGQFPRKEGADANLQTAPSLPPTPAPANTAQLRESGNLGGLLPPTVPPNAPANMAYKDPRTSESNKAYGKEEGKALYEERKSLSGLYGSNSKLLGQLNLLEGIYNNPNIPEGELAGQISAFRSGMKSLGVEVSDKAGLTDLAKAVSTGLALTQRTADGQNLLPGAMSNYEDQLLQKMSPTLSLTNEGRLALIQMMKQVAQSNLRYAEEGTKLASANKDMLPASWAARKERIMLEEMAKMKMMSDQLIKQYGGKR